MDAVEFGRYLRQQRELRGLTRAQVAASTRIALSLVIALEEGDQHRFPARIFVVNQIRLYAGAIGLAPEEAVLRYDELATLPEPSIPERPKLASEARKGFLLFVGFLLFLAAVVYLLLALKGRAPWPHRR